MSVPFVAFTAYAALTQVSDETIEASHLDGATALQRFRHIVYPTIKPVLTIVLLLQIVWDLRVFAQIDFLQGVGGSVSETHLLGTYIYTLGIGQSDYGSASALAMFVLVLTLALTFRYVRRLLSEDADERPDAGCGASSRSVIAADLGVPGLLGRSTARSSRSRSSAPPTRRSSPTSPRRRSTGCSTTSFVDSLKLSLTVTLLAIVAATFCGFVARRRDLAVPVQGPQVVHLHRAGDPDDPARGAVHLPVQDAQRVGPLQQHRRASACSTPR